MLSFIVWQQSIKELSSIGVGCFDENLFWSEFQSQFDFPVVLFFVRAAIFSRDRKLPFSFDLLPPPSSPVERLLNLSFFRSANFSLFFPNLIPLSQNFVGSVLVSNE